MQIKIYRQPVTVGYEDLRNTVYPILPKQATTHARGFDVCAFLPDPLGRANGMEMFIEPLSVAIVPTGLFMALPPGSCMMVCSRSGLAAKGLVVLNAPGIIDSDYRDECQVIMTYIAPPNTPPFVISHNMRIAQLVYLPPATDVLAEPNFSTVSNLDDLPDPGSNRKGGFGSTGE